MGILNLTTRIRQELENIPLINTATFGDLDTIDLSKSTQFPLGHVTLESGNIGSAATEVNVAIVLADIVDSDDDTTSFDSAEMYVMNNMLMAATKISQDLQRGNLYRDGFQVEGAIDFEFFNERFEDLLAGVVMTFTVTIDNSIDLC